MHDEEPQVILQLRFSEFDTVAECVNNAISLAVGMGLEPGDDELDALVRVRDICDMVSAAASKQEEDE